MRLSRLHAPTLKEDPSEAEVASHRLLVRAGMIRQVARGIYDLLPLGLRSVRKIERIIREELDRVGCQEVLLPVVTPAELWQESGRWDYYGRELLRVRDRHDRDFCIGPTHEEVITDLVRRDVRSYRALPLNLYQIQTKFRDEIRPRFGLMRGREFIMKDGYSFHTSYEDCRREYEVMRGAYSRIFQRCGLAFRAVEADTGAIGGSMSHEFQVLARSGEDLILSCDACEYAANVEKACSARSTVPDSERGERVEIPTPGVTTIEEVSAFLGEPSARFVKTLIYVADERAVAVLLRGDDQLSEAKLKTALGANALRMAEDAEILAHTGGPQGFSGPVGLSIAVYADLRLEDAVGLISGANKKDTHVKGIDHRRDFANAEMLDLRTARAGEQCPRCHGRLQEHRGIEVGQVFYLGDKYSKKLCATFLDPEGREQVIEMGTYGIGVTRTLAAAIEQNHDDAGIIWPIAIAPYEAIVVSLKQDELTSGCAEAVYEALEQAGVDVLYDDRDERAGVKFNDADLLGIPLRVTVGPRGVARGVVELKRRGQAEASDVVIADVARHIAAIVAAEKSA